jgi:hypothetical protein
MNGFGSEGGCRVTKKTRTKTDAKPQPPGNAVTKVVATKPGSVRRKTVPEAPAVTTFSRDSTRAESPSELELLEREAREHGGGVVARLPDGENIYAKNFDALFELMDARGRGLDNVRLEDIPSSDAFELL